MLTISSAMVATEVLHGFIRHRQLDLLVVLLCRFRLKVSPSWTSGCFPRSLMTKFKGILGPVSVMICKKKILRMLLTFNYSYLYC